MINKVVEFGVSLAMFGVLNLMVGVFIALLGYFVESGISKEWWHRDDSRRHEIHGFVRSGDPK